MLTSEKAFELAHTHVAKWEGGFFDHPNDPGGVTMYGVSLMFLKSLDLIEGDIDGDGDIDRDDVLAITRDTARQIFRRHFWDKPNAGELPSLVAVCFYDLAVNAGTGRAAIVLQEGINTIYPKAIPRLAPNVGPLTRTWSRRAVTDDRQLELCHAYLNRREAWYRRLANAKPKSAVFLKGWL
ncbi:MAG: hypothetical protein K2O70_03930, partial [Desulfovibrionaceae bacterium]|nr:hypothetical protein [Desulfovibrionaceae bacterium]